MPVQFFLREQGDNQRERGALAGIFGCMINLGRLRANKLLPALLAGFVFLGVWHAPPRHWRWLFWIPAVAAAGSLRSGSGSDRFRGSRRAPVATAIYLIEVGVIAAATKARTVNAARVFSVPGAVRRARRHQDACDLAPDESEAGCNG